MMTNSPGPRNSKGEGAGTEPSAAAYAAAKTSQSVYVLSSACKEASPSAARDAAAGEKVATSSDICSVGWKTGAIQSKKQPMQTAAEMAEPGAAWQPGRTEEASIQPSSGSALTSLALAGQAQ